MTTFLYARVSTADQNTAAQVDALTQAHPNGVLREEKASATNMERPVLLLLLDMLHKGDELVVWKLDRLARNMADLLAIVEQIREKGASLKILDQNIDTGTATGRAFLQMLGVFAEFETNLRKERQMAGIAKAKAEGRYKGRPTTIDPEEVRHCIEVEKLSFRATAKKLGIAVSSVQRLAKAG
ncbi:Site-specific DNA recombinase [Microbulbifer donghaiensis]|uniref:Site-specific DNA recombinase n=1 Tax=Microbulbifer donghaiensis TaxID=494016 RepID=A0A1M4X5Q8_9GAMM|nr:recombinase family protein [Microbulbifer donghaiensis]SHE88767.1 Site-specific DNA recombinase [Microbulbifer donghaiensis]